MNHNAEYADPDKNESSPKDPSADDNYQDPSRLEYHQTGDPHLVSAPSGGKKIVARRPSYLSL